MNELSNYAIKPLICNETRKLLGFIAIQIPTTRMIKNLQSDDVFLRIANIIFDGRGTAGLSSYYVQNNFQVRYSANYNDCSAFSMRTITTNSLTLSRQFLELEKFIVNN
jgi:hypothetical protein